MGQIRDLAMLLHAVITCIRCRWWAGDKVGRRTQQTVVEVKEKRESKREREIERDRERGDRQWERERESRMWTAWNIIGTLLEHSHNI
jgi:hypothetical protein